MIRIFEAKHQHNSASIMNNSMNTTMSTNGNSPIYDSGDNAWMLTATTLVLLMTPALAFFYGGMVDRKNVLNQLFLSFICMGIVIVQWVLLGFSFAFGPPVSEGFGSFDWAVLRFGEIQNSYYSPTYPLLTFCVSGLVASTILGKRHDYDPRSTTAHNLPFTILGTCLLWVGWNGFNAGSANAASGIAALALVNTNVAAASALVTWVVIDAARGHIAVSGACTGSIVDLVAITPACGFVQPGWGLLIGIIGAIIVCCLLLLKRYMRFDDTLDVAVVHGGISGAFMTGLFAQKMVNPGGADGAFYGHTAQLWYQIAAILTAVDKYQN
ncbi:unnamed protein product [Rotaria socialis]|uniref:Ammonium transporter AmtB-like domain-containing protein n=1 Tax=Rotaria socialis TaxID=392032 RepID=A0A821I221_9BILA|nr:unnamed protein product [Rotaria socialis]